jgi:signal transduction histidine kinase
VRGVVESIAEWAVPLAESRNLSISFHVDASVPRTAVGDGLRVTQVVNNLVQNAIKFTEHGRVDVRVGCRTPAPVPDGSAGGHGTWVEFSVTDTGIGIAEKDLHRLFEPFTQADPSATRGYQGIGLGLAICRDLVDLMDGHLQTSSRTGAGSTFTFGLPLGRVDDDDADAGDQDPSRNAVPSPPSRAHRDARPGDGTGGRPAAVEAPHDRDAERARALQRYEVLDAGPRRELEALVELAAVFTGVPMATINLITDTEQVQVATYGFTGGRSAREDSFCTAVVDLQRPVIIEDARLDERFASNPHATGEREAIRFYGAHPLVTPEGVTVGTLCVYDRETHQVTPQIAHALETLADRVVDVLELELTSRRLVAANERLGAFAGQISHDLRNPLAAVSRSL